MGLLWIHCGGKTPAAKTWPGNIFQSWCTVPQPSRAIFHTQDHQLALGQTTLSSLVAAFTPVSNMTCTSSPGVSPPSQIIRQWCDSLVWVSTESGPSATNFGQQLALSCTPASDGAYWVVSNYTGTEAKACLFKEKSIADCKKILEKQNKTVQLLLFIWIKL